MSSFNNFENDFNVSMLPIAIFLIFFLVYRWANGVKPEVSNAIDAHSLIPIFPKHVKHLYSYRIFLSKLISFN